MLRYEVPVVYHLLRKLAAPAQGLFEPPWQLVKAVCEGSDDPSLRKSKFQRYMEEYRQHGLYCRRAKRLTPQRRTYYESMRRAKIAAFIAQHREVLLTLRREARRQGDEPQYLLDHVKEILKIQT